VFGEKNRATTWVLVPVPWMNAPFFEIALRLRSGGRSMSSRQSNAGPETDVAKQTWRSVIFKTRPEWNNLAQSYRVSHRGGKFHWDRYYWQLRFTAATHHDRALRPPLWFRISIAERSECDRERGVKFLIVKVAVPILPLVPALPVPPSHASPLVWYCRMRIPFRMPSDSIRGRLPALSPPQLCAHHRREEAS
jgi:hypothetical protein